jgi:hypothetical protein
MAIPPSSFLIGRDALQVAEFLFDFRNLFFVAPRPRTGTFLRTLPSLRRAHRLFVRMRKTRRPRTLARRHIEIHSFRSRHSRGAAPAPASLPPLTVPQQVRFGRAPCRKRRIDPLGARPLRQRIPGGRSDGVRVHCTPSHEWSPPPRLRSETREPGSLHRRQSPSGKSRYSRGTGVGFPPLLPVDGSSGRIGGR